MHFKCVLNFGEEQASEMPAYLAPGAAFGNKLSAAHRGEQYGSSCNGEVNSPRLPLQGSTGYAPDPAAAAKKGIARATLATLGTWRGMAAVIVVPRPLALSIVNVPPSSFALSRMLTSPNPLFLCR